MLINIITIIGAVAACVAAIVAVLTIRDSKRNILKRIAKKEQQLRAIDNAAFLQRKSIPTQITPLDEKRERTQKEIEYLKRLL